jgi:hypothetical protein
LNTTPDTQAHIQPHRSCPAAAGCLLAALAGLLGFLCVWTALTLGAQGELTWRLGHPTELRVWLLRGDDVAGVGWSRGAVVERRESTVCVRTLVGFWAWRGAAPEPAPPACDCYRRQGSAWLAQGACPP